MPQDVPRAGWWADPYARMYTNQLAPSQTKRLRYNPISAK
jgi:hypothetical protein